MPTEHTLKKSLLSIFLNNKNDTIVNEKYKIDVCCRSLHKCDAHRRAELNHSTDNHISYCECVQSFQKCLRNLNQTLSNEVAFIHSLNATKCFTTIHPIIKCIKFEQHSESTDQIIKFTTMNERENYFKRCTKYELDLSRKEELQIIDLPFIDKTGRLFHKTKQHYEPLFIFLFDIYLHCIQCGKLTV